MCGTTTRYARPWGKRGWLSFLAFLPGILYQMSPTKLPPSPVSPRRTHPGLAFLPGIPSQMSSTKPPPSPESPQNTCALHHILCGTALGSVNWLSFSALTILSPDSSSHDNLLNNQVPGESIPRLHDDTFDAVFQAVLHTCSEAPADNNRISSTDCWVTELRRRLPTSSCRTRHAPSLPRLAVLAVPNVCRGRSSNVNHTLHAQGRSGLPVARRHQAKVYTLANLAEHCQRQASLAERRRGVPPQQASLGHRA